MTHRTALAASFAAAGLGGLGCSKAGDDGTGTRQSPAATQALTAPTAAASAGNCGHAACADNFFVDTVAGECVAGAADAPCTVTVKLVATGDFHINDEYPYRFKADDAPGVQFLGTDAAGKNAFTKAAGDWQKTEEKAGTMSVKFTPAGRGSKEVAGTLKLSVCSAQNCLLEQRHVSATVIAK
jgi:hypothetical protein